MSRTTVAPRECPVCACRTVEPDAEPFGTWTWRCNVCGYAEYEDPQATSGEQRAWVAYFAQTRPHERADWTEQYHLERRKEWH